MLIGESDAQLRHRIVEVSQRDEDSPTGVLLVALGIVSFIWLPARKFIARSLQTSMLSRHKRSQRIINPLRKSYRQREMDLIELLPHLNTSLALSFIMKYLARVKSYWNYIFYKYFPNIKWISKYFIETNVR